MALLSTMKSSYQGGEFILLYVLQFVDKQRHRGSSCFCRKTKLLDQGLKVMFKVAVVSEARLWVVIYSDLDVVIGSSAC